MTNLKEQCSIIVADALNKFATENNLQTSIPIENLVIETPPNPVLGDVGIPMFPFAKVLRKAPPMIAEAVVAIVSKDERSASIGQFLAVGPYVNLKLNKVAAISDTLVLIQNQGEKYGTLDSKGEVPLKGRRVMVEFSSPNTNKPLRCPWRKYFSYLKRSRCRSI